MMQRKALFLAAALCSPLVSAYESYVFCSGVNSLDWEWLPNNRHVTGPIKLKAVVGDDVLRIRRVMEIQKIDYDNLVAECENYYPHLPNPQPANHWYSDWYGFAVRNEVMPAIDQTQQPIDWNIESHRIAYFNFLARYMNKFEREAANNTRAIIHDDLPDYLDRKQYMK